MLSFDKLILIGKKAYNKGLAESEKGIYWGNDPRFYFNNAIFVSNYLLENFTSEKEFVQAKFLRGVAYEGVGENLNFLSDMKSVLQIQPGNFSANRSLARFYFHKLGDEELAYEYLAKSSGSLFINQKSNLFNSLGDYLEYIKEGYKNIGIKELPTGPFDI